MEFNSYFFCQLTLQLMVDPVIDSEGNTYERAAIEEWIKKQGTSPITRNPISIADLRHNRVLKCAIAEEIAKAKSAALKTVPAPAAIPELLDPTPEPDMIDLAAGVEDIKINGLCTPMDGLVNVQSFEGFSLAKVAVFLFTGRQNSLVMLQHSHGVRGVPEGDILWSDGTILNAANRILRNDLGVHHINMNNLRRFVWKGNTAIYTASTRDVINTRRRHGHARILLTPVAQLVSTSADSSTGGDVRMEEPSRLLTDAVLDHLRILTSKPTYECRVGDDKWAPYEQRIQRAIERAEKESQDTLRVMIRAVPYDIHIGAMSQRRVDGKFDTVREIRKVTTQDFCN